MDHTELIAALREHRANAMENFQTTFTPLLRYIIAPILPDERDQNFSAWDSRKISCPS